MTARQAAKIFENEVQGKEKIFLLKESSHFFHIYTEESAGGNMCLPIAFVEKSTGKMIRADSDEAECYDAFRENGYDPVSQKVLDVPVPESEYR